MEINVSIDAGIMIAPIEILGISKDINPIETAPTMIGNKLMMHNTFPIPAQFGKTNGRLIIQPYVVQCDNLDTICYSHPIIYDGEQYKLTQERRMGYDLRHDPLAQFASSSPLTENRMNVSWEDPYPCPTRPKTILVMRLSNWKISM